MTKQEEDARIAAAVQKQLEKIVAAQQKQFSQVLEKTMKDALKGVEKANAALRKERDAVVQQLAVAQKASALAEKEGDKMAEAYFDRRQKQFREAAQTELLRDLVIMHLQVGKTIRDIAVWLDLPKDFILNARQLMENNAKFAGDKPKRIQLEGNPKLRYEDSGRGGTIWFESRETSFDMWWEFAGGKAIVIVDIPTEEQWEARTKLPLEKRESILQFIGEQIVIDKISYDGSFIVGENVITFYSEK